MKKKKSGRNKQRTANKAVDEPNEIKKAPHTYVIHRGLSCKYFSISAFPFFIYKSYFRPCYAHVVKRFS